MQLSLQLTLAQVEQSTACSVCSVVQVQVQVQVQDAGTEQDHNTDG